MMSPCCLPPNKESSGVLVISIEAEAFLLFSSPYNDAAPTTAASSTVLMPFALGWIETKLESHDDEWQKLFSGDSSESQKHFLFQVALNHCRFDKDPGFPA